MKDWNAWAWDVLFRYLFILFVFTVFVCSLPRYI